MIPLPADRIDKTNKSSADRCGRGRRGTFCATDFARLASRLRAGQRQVVGVGMIPPLAPGCQGQPMMTIIMKDCAQLGKRVVIIAAARRGDPCSRREAQVVG